MAAPWALCPLLDPTVLNSVGLAFDIVGAILLYRFGLPSRASMGGAMTQAVAEQLPDEPLGRASARLLKHAKIGSSLGVGFLVFGFALQIVSNHL